ncbi:MAG: ribosome biogenesis GTP-binding protein YihA/YsxC [Granulosicoccus sp.]
MNSLYFSAQFESSASDPYACPEAVSEVAFAGRSNAGKSSAINAITRNNKLARTGKTPGRTQLINHFALDEQHYLVDLPGYGYAKVSKSRQRQWHAAMTQYLISRQCLAGLILVMDIRHPLTETDWQLIELQQSGGSGLHVLLTKSDKLSRGNASGALLSTQQQLAEAGIEATIQTFSALKKDGIDDVHAVLDHWLFDAPLSV